MTAIVYLYDDYGNLIEKRDVPPSNISYNSYDGILIERTDYCFSYSKLIAMDESMGKKEIKNDSTTIQ